MYLMTLTVEELCVDVDEDNDIVMVDVDAEAFGGGEADAHGDVNTLVFDDWYFKQ